MAAINTKTFSLRAKKVAISPDVSFSNLNKFQKAENETHEMLVKDKNTLVFLPDSIMDLKLERDLLVENIPFEYMSFFAHANSDKVSVFKTINPIDDSSVEFTPTIFENTKDKPFKLINLFLCQMDLSVSYQQSPFEENMTHTRALCKS